MSLPAHFPAAYDPQATPESEAARRRTPERYSVVAFRIPTAEARAGRPDDGPAPHPLDVVGSVRAWWRAQGVSVDGWEAMRVGIYLLGAAAALAYIAVTFGYDNRCAAAAGPQGALEAMLAAAGGAPSGMGGEALGEGAAAVPPLGGAGSSGGSSGGRDVGLVAWAGEVGYVALRRFASGLARMPITGDALWALGITGGGGSVAVPPAGSGLAAAAAATQQWSESGAPGGGGTEFGGAPDAAFATAPLGCSAAETALAAHRLAWSSALLYALLGCFAAVSLVRILRKNADAMRVRAVVKAMQRETAAARGGGGGGAAQRDQAGGSSGTGARQRKAAGATTQ